jgi:hypothetical protein
MLVAFQVIYHQSPPPPPLPFLPEPPLPISCAESNGPDGCLFVIGGKRLCPPLIVSLHIVEVVADEFGQKCSSSRFDGGDIFFQSFNGTHWLQEPPLPKVLQQISAMLTSPHFLQSVALLPPSATRCSCADRSGGARPGASKLAWRWIGSAGWATVHCGLRHAVHLPVLRRR